MKYFKELTSRTAEPGKRNAVIMGRKTWESIPAKFRPLPGRINVVLTRGAGGENASDNPAAALTEASKQEGVHLSASLEGALELLSGPVFEGAVETVFVIGGGQVYKEALESPLLEAVHLTVVEAEAECDTFMPPVDESRFRLWSASAPRRDAPDAPRYSFLCYTRVGGASLEGPPALPPAVAAPHEEYQYLEMIEEVMRHGVYRGDRTGTGTYSKFGTTMRFNLRYSFPLLTSKRVFWRGVAEELLWFVSGATNAALLRDRGIHIWDGNGSREYLESIGLGHREEMDLGPVYGFQWRHFGAAYTDMHADYSGQGVDQLAELIHKIKTNPNDRRLVLTAWNPAALQDMALPPCHMFCQFYVADGELSCQMYQRSCDLGLGVPFNIASYSLLTCMLAQVCGLRPGDFVHVLGDAHAYANHCEPLKEQLKNAPRHFPKLRINPAKTDIDSFVFEDFELEGYAPHKAIKMQMAVQRRLNGATPTMSARSWGLGDQAPLLLLLLLLLPVVTPQTTVDVYPLLEDKIAAAAAEAAGGTANCPRAALFFAITMPAVKHRGAFRPLKLSYKQAFQRLAPGATFVVVGAAPAPGGGLIVHTVALLKGAVTGAGWSAAKGLHVALRSGPPAGLQGGAFGKSSVDVLASPFLADSQGGVIANLKDSRPLGMISFAWEDRQVTPQLKDAYMASIRKLLPGSTVTVEQRTELGATGNKTVFETLVAHSSAPALSAALKKLRSQSASVWPAAQFGRMNARNGQAVRWQPLPTFISPCEARTIMQLVGMVAQAPTFDRTAKAAYLAALRAQLPKGVTTTVSSAAKAPGGWKVVTLSTYATNQQAAAVSLARRLLPSNAPLGAAPLGAGKPWRVFLTEATASTRGKRASVFAGHVLMVSAAETGSGTGIATAAAYPADAFIKYEFRLRQASCPKCATLAVQSKDPTAALTGLAPSSNYNVTVIGWVQSGSKMTWAANWLTLTTQQRRSLRLTSATAVNATSANVAALASPNAGFASYVFSLKTAGCAACAAKNVTSTAPAARVNSLVPGAKYDVSVTAFVSGRSVRGNNTLQLTMPPSLRLTSALAANSSAVVVTATPLPNNAFSKFKFYASAVGGASRPAQESRTPGATLLGLKSGTRYTIRVEGISKAGRITAGANTLQVATPMGLVVDTAFASAPTRGNVTCKPDAGSAFVKYTWYARNGTAAACQACPSTCCLKKQTTQPQTTFDGLQPNNTYAVTVEGVDASGKAYLSSNSMSLKTPAGQPGGSRPPPPNPSPPAPSPPPPSPSLPTPSLVSILLRGHTSVESTAAAPIGTWYKEWLFVAAEVATTRRRGLLDVTELTAESLNPRALITGLLPATTYEMHVVGVHADGTQSPASNSLTLTTPPIGAPVILSAKPADSTTAVLVLQPPQTEQAVVGYTASLCLPGGGANCQGSSGTTSPMLLEGLSPGATYEVTAQALLSGGGTTPPSNTLSFTMPPLGAPALLAAEATGATTATASAAPPDGVTIAKYTFTARPLSGGADVTVTTTTAAAEFRGLQSAEQYEVSVVGVHGGGSLSPASNTINIVMLAEG
ncbi:bifunctional dihydrofolate reductase-thymidylate synthase, partial [Micractinium conductrix]